MEILVYVVPCVVALLIVLVICMIRVAIQAWGSRPVRVVLSKANRERPASTVQLGPYVEYTSKQFPQHLDSFRNEH